MEELETTITDVPVKTGRRAIIRAVSVVAAWRRQEVVSWGGDG